MQGGVSQNRSFISLHTNTATTKPAKPETSWNLQSFCQDEWGQKRSSLGQKLCRSYLNTYHYTTGSRRTRGSRGRRKKKRGKTQSILRIRSGSSGASTLGTQNNTENEQERQLSTSLQAREAAGHAYFTHLEMQLTTLCQRTDVGRQLRNANSCPGMVCAVTVIKGTSSILLPHFSQSLLSAKSMLSTMGSTQLKFNSSTFHWAK